MQRHSYDTIMADHLSKCSHVILTTSDMMASRVAWLFRYHIWKFHGLLEEVVSDQGTQFMLNLMCTLSQLLGIKVTASTAYHLQTDRQAKQVNQELKQFLQLFVNQWQDDWYKWLSI